MKESGGGSKRAVNEIYSREMFRSSLFIHDSGLSKSYNFPRISLKLHPESFTAFAFHL